MDLDHRRVDRCGHQRDLLGEFWLTATNAAGATAAPPSNGVVVEAPAAREA